MISNSIYKRLSISNLVSVDIRAIIEEYWQYEADEFVNDPKTLAKKHGLTLKSLIKLVSTYSTFIYHHSNCLDCNKAILRQIERQADIAQLHRNSFCVCYDCKERQEKELELRQEAIRNAELSGKSIYTVVPCTVISPKR